MVTIVIHKKGFFSVDKQRKRKTFTSNYFNDKIILPIYNLQFPNGNASQKKNSCIHFDEAESHKEHSATEFLNESPFDFIQCPIFLFYITLMNFELFCTNKEMMQIETSESE